MFYREPSVCAFPDGTLVVSASKDVSRGFVLWISQRDGEGWEEIGGTAMIGDTWKTGDLADRAGVTPGDWITLADLAQVLQGAPMSKATFGDVEHAVHTIATIKARNISAAPTTNSTSES